LNINLSPVALNTVKQTSNSQPIQQFVEELLEQLFQSESVYLILKPAPPIDRMRAITSFINTMINSEKFYGFHFLTEEESSRMMADIAVKQAQDQEKENATNNGTTEDNSETAQSERSESNGSPFLLKK